MPREQKDFISKLIAPRLEEDTPLTRALVDIYEVLNKLVDHVNEAKGVGVGGRAMDESALPGSIRVRKNKDTVSVYVKGPHGWLENTSAWQLIKKKDK
jgi:hypothetical protein